MLPILLKYLQNKIIQFCDFTANPKIKIFKYPLKQGRLCLFFNILLNKINKNFDL